MQAPGHSASLPCHSHTLTEESADPKKMTMYAICLANRSAALYHLREYHYCVKDIDEALEHHYPKVSHGRQRRRERQTVEE